MGDLYRFCCIDSGRLEHGKWGTGNLTAFHRYSPDKARRMLRCRACKTRFSECQGTPLFGFRLPPEKAVSNLHHIAEGNGGRKTGRLVGVNRLTVALYGLSSPSALCCDTLSGRWISPRQGRHNRARGCDSGRGRGCARRR
jgi:hypothetical protein